MSDLIERVQSYLDSCGVYMHPEDRNYIINLVLEEAVARVEHVLEEECVDVGSGDVILAALQVMMK